MQIKGTIAKRVNKYWETDVVACSALCWYIYIILIYSWYSFIKPLFLLSYQQRSDTIMVSRVIWLWLGPGAHQSCSVTSLLRCTGERKYNKRLVVSTGKSLSSCCCGQNTQLGDISLVYYQSNLTRVRRNKTKHYNPATPPFLTDSASFPFSLPPLQCCWWAQPWSVGVGWCWLCWTWGKFWQLSREAKSVVSSCFPPSPASKPWPHKPNTFPPLSLVLVYMNNAQFSDTGPLLIL